MKPSIERPACTPSPTSDTKNTFCIISPPYFKVNNFVNCEEILFKAPIPRQGILLIGDFRDDINYHLKVFQPNINNTAINNIIFRIANSKFNYITNCPIAFATTIECIPATDVQFNALHTDLIYVYSSS